MIVGLGTDLVDVPRFSKSIENESFIRRVFSSAEIEYCNSVANKAERFAARFAAKEAFAKALGTGFREGMAFKEVEVVNNENGKPSIQLIGATAKALSNVNMAKVLLTISHTTTMATATVILQD